MLSAAKNPHVAYRGFFAEFILERSEGLSMTGEAVLDLIHSRLQG
jgi:hypothetical protein